mmetsp:Transcript_24221/g.54462  ORF Transcript_24221/g.54462 Transcript_24221/m.54462 type:complete len:221 (-) Transcript_24221:1857-2519(-)
MSAAPTTCVLSLVMIILSIHSLPKCLRRKSYFSLAQGPGHTGCGAVTRRTSTPRSTISFKASMAPGSGSSSAKNPGDAMTSMTFARSCSSKLCSISKCSLLRTLDSISFWRASSAPMALPYLLMNIPSQSTTVLSMSTKIVRPAIFDGFSTWHADVSAVPFRFRGGTVQPPTMRRGAMLLLLADVWGGSSPTLGPLLSRLSSISSSITSPYLAIIASYEN